MSLNKIISGISERKSVGRLTLFLFSIIYFLNVLYSILFYEINWLNEGIPAEIYFGGYRYTEINNYAAVLSFILVLKFFIEISWLSHQSRAFFNNTNMKLLKVSEMKADKMYLLYLFNRWVKLSLLNVLVIIPLLLGFVIKYQILVSSLIINIYILVYSSLLLILVYDATYFTLKRSNSSHTLTILLLILIPLANSMLHSYVLNYSWGSDLLKVYNILPDILSMYYHYFLYSFGSLYSFEKLAYPMVFMLLLFSINYKKSSRMYIKMLSAK